MHQEKLLLIGVRRDFIPPDEFELSMSELVELVRTAGGTVSEVITQKRRAIDPRFYIGKGKVEEIRASFGELGSPDAVIFNDELSPAQIRNLEKEWHKKVLTRTELILDIFAQHARSKAASLQVELAQLSYELPRLTGKGVEMSRLGGGIGTRGPGEKQMEYDRREIEKRISWIRKKMKELERERQEQRKQRVQNGFLAAVIGYTNSGKSTLLNRLTKADILAEDKLFATLDTTSRRLWIGDEKRGVSVVLIDTVGFIQDIPHGLIESFKSTLEDTLQAKLLIHVLDISTPGYELRNKVVEKTLSEIGAGEIPRILCLNKIDLLPEIDVLKFRMLFPEALALSAKENINLDILKEQIMSRVK